MKIKIDLYGKRLMLELRSKKAKKGKIYFVRDIKMLKPNE